MNAWDFSAPASSELTDKAVVINYHYLKGKTIALLLTGSIAVIKLPLLIRELRRYGAEIYVFASTEALRYTTEETLKWCSQNVVITQLTAEAEHLSDGLEFDAYLVAPATYNTINKFANGIADSLVSSVLASALGRMEQGKTQILIAPALHGSMHNQLLIHSLQRLKQMGVVIIPPRQQYGKDNLAENEIIIASLCRTTSQSKLKGQSILVTAGPTPVKIDSIRHISTKFTGELGGKIAENLYLKGAEVFLLHHGCYQPKYALPSVRFSDYQDYYQQVIQQLEQGQYQVGIFSAAVADYQPKQILSGKTPSGGQLTSIELKATKKVVEWVRQQFPDLFMVTFKYEEGLSHQQLIQIAEHKIQTLAYQAVIANRGEDAQEVGEQVAYLVQNQQPPQRWVGKSQIAEGIGEFLENYQIIIDSQ